MNRLLDRARSSNRLHGDAGSMVVEFAFAAPLIATMFIGTLEFGVAFRDKNTLENSVRQSLRVNTNLQNKRWADADALLSFKSILAGEKRLTIKKVIIWKSSAGGTSPSAACLAVTPPAYTGLPPSGGGGPPYGVADCNVYSADQINYLTTANEATYFDAVTATACSGSAWDSFYCPKNRNTQQVSADYIGMMVVADYARLTKIVPANATITDKAIMRVEPS